MLYTKTINGRQVISDCSTIQDNNNLWVSNPSPEQIADAGWVEYVQPTVEHLAKEEPDFSDIISAIKKMVASNVQELSDEDALTVAALYPTWADRLESGDAAVVGERMWYDGKLWKVILGHTMQREWTPDVAVSLFTEVSIAEIPNWRRPTGAQNAYMAGDKVRYNGVVWTSDVDNNVWEPGIYGWTSENGTEELQNNESGNTEPSEWVQPTGQSDAYMTGDEVSYEGGIWVSDIDNNTWAPGVYGWTQLS